MVGTTSITSRNAVHLDHPKVNSLYFGDNLNMLREHIPAESVDLAYLHPPFHSKRDYSARLKTPKGREECAKVLLLIVGVLTLVGIVSCSPMPQYGRDPRVLRVEPPESGFFSKRLDCAGIAIESSSVVPDTALAIACDRISRMLEHLPNVRANLVFSGAAFHVIGRNQVTTDLPENRQMKNVPRQAQPDEPITDVDERTRGLGGLVASCGEENLLKLPHDRYFGRDICVHEFAHTIFENGFTDAAREAIVRQYNVSLSKNLWRHNYAHENASEYFAELAMWYFGTHGDDPGGFIGVGRYDLRRYDADSYKLLDSIFSGAFAIEADSSLIGDTVQMFPYTHNLRSGSGEACTLTVINRTSNSISMYWVDFGGQRKYYQLIRPGARWNQNTFVSHVWIAVDNTGHDLCEFVARSHRNIAIIK